MTPEQPEQPTTPEKPMKSEKLDYAEEQAVRNAEFHLKNVESLQKEAHLTFTVLIAAIPAAFTYGVNLCSKGLWEWAIGCFVLAVYFWAFAVYLLRAVRPRGIHAPGNEPNSLLPALRDDRYSVDEIRATELTNLQERIDANRIRCEQTGAIIRRTRDALVWCPAVYAGTEFIVWTFTFGR